MKRTWAVTSVLVLASGMAFAQDLTAQDPLAKLPVPDHARFLELDQNRDGALSPDEARTDPVAANYFTQADSDADGRLNEEEYLAIARATAFGPGNANGAASGRAGTGGADEERLLGPPNIEGASENAPGTGPTGGSGGTGATTGADTTVILVPVTPSEGVDEFARLDLDRDGAISREEARENSIANQFGEVDRDSDGRINIHEYQAYGESANGSSSVGTPPGGEQVSPPR